MLSHHCRYIHLLQNKSKQVGYKTILFKFSKKQKQKTEKQNHYQNLLRIITPKIITLRKALTVLSGNKQAVTQESA